MHFSVQSRVDFSVDVQRPGLSVCVSQTPTLTAENRPTLISVKRSCSPRLTPTRQRLIIFYYMSIEVQTFTCQCGREPYEINTKNICGGVYFWPTCTLATTFLIDSLPGVDVDLSQDFEKP